MRAPEERSHNPSHSAELNLGSYFKRMLKRIGHGERPFDERPGLTALTHITCAYYDIELGINPDLIGFFLRLPAIKAIYANSVGHTPNLNIRGGMLEPIQLGISNLTHIELENCGLRSEDLGHILRANKCLQTFIYEIGGISWREVSLQGLQQVLTLVASSLENLWIGYDASYYESQPLSPMSFTTFEYLRFLRVPSTFILGNPPRDGTHSHSKYSLAGIFPCQLEILEIAYNQCDGLSLIGTLTELLWQNQIGGELTHLKKIILKGDTLKQDDSSLLRKFAPFIDMAEVVAGINVTVVDGLREHYYTDSREVLYGIGRGTGWAPDLLSPPRNRWWFW